ncbi:MAG TPA: acetyl-CoA carboxylase biotin carboxyl carrier protein [Thermoanaerobaculia bacterium]|nr:acetyl-CoA carboxylase biotin carboxyl carrier protein [Thermoanaerobaculia bacterium]
MTFKEILELMAKVAEYGLGAVEIERAGTRIRIEGKPAAARPVSQSLDDGGDVSSRQTLVPSPGAVPLPAASNAPLEEPEAGLHIITSPIVGTFYRSPNPESDAFVSAGDRVSKGKVLCIIEAMKLMNEIECDVDGVLVSVYPQNGQPIEYGENLFAVRV